MKNRISGFVIPVKNEVDIHSGRVPFRAVLFERKLKI
jgi:hypothetical protein